jgi:hypothetical protein
LKPHQNASLSLNKPAGAARSAAFASSSNVFHWRDIGVVLLVAWLVRLVFILVAPPEARSVDNYDWEHVANILKAGGNPYKETSFLNWPPFWMQFIYLISKTAALLAVPFVRVLQGFLILVETAVVIVLIKLIRDVVPAAKVRGLVIVGLALNPAAVFLVCQHCNFDVLVALWLVLFVDSLLRYNHVEESTDWLAACLFLGLGILTKTVPLILAPLLVSGFRRMALRTKFLGLVLLLGPVTLGMSVIYVLAPSDVTAKVLAYRSTPGFFGISGLLHLAGADALIGFANLSFYLLLAAALLYLSALLWRRGCLGGRETVLCVALLLAATPVIGPGYGPQYLYWFMPFLIASYAFFGVGWRRVLAGFAVICATTYCIEYSLFPSHGRFLTIMLIHAQKIPLAQSLFDWGGHWSSPTGQTLIRLPLFAAYLALLATGFRILLRSLRKPQGTNHPGDE